MLMRTGLRVARRAAATRGFASKGDEFIPTEIEQATGRRGEEIEDFAVGAERFNRYTLFVETMGTKESPTLTTGSPPRP